MKSKEIETRRRELDLIEMDQRQAKLNETSSLADHLDNQEDFKLRNKQLGLKRSSTLIN